MQEKHEAKSPAAISHNQCQYWWRSVRVGWRLILYHGHKKGMSESVFAGCVNNKKIPYLSAGWLWAWSLGQLCNREYMGYYHRWLVGISVRYSSLMLKDYCVSFTRAPGSWTLSFTQKKKKNQNQLIAGSYLNIWGRCAGTPTTRRPHRDWNNPQLLSPVSSSLSYHQSCGWHANVYRRIESVL